MIKGIYNENEFYTNFYWDNKFADDLKSKLGDAPGVVSAVAALKALDIRYWELKEADNEAELKERLRDFYSALFEALGYRAEVLEQQTADGEFYSTIVNSKKGDASELMAILTDQAETGSFESTPLFLGVSSGAEVKIVGMELSELIQQEFQDSQHPPRWMLIGAPNALFVLERGKWAFGRFIKIDLQEIFLQRDQKPYELVYGLAARAVLCPDSGGSVHDEFDDNSHRHAFEVTTELRENVREAIELLINEMIDLKKESHQKIYSGSASDVYAKELTHDALYYVYRLLFLLYLEAQGEDSELLPLKSEIYRYGYSLEKLLELDFVQIQPDSAEAKGTFIYESLDKIFELIFNGFEPGAKEGLLKQVASPSGFLVKGIKSDLFDPNVVRHLKGVKLRNGVLHEILRKLSLTRPRKKERVTRVSYANLGINQLGAVYEGLLSYSGFFAQEDLHALKPASVKQSDIDNGKELAQVYLAPKSVVDRYRTIAEKKYRLTDDNIVLDEQGNPRVFRKGSFVYRLAGRDRQKLASYYTPESLTKCTVKYALRVLFEKKRTPKELWAVKVLEPAMGSGAFLNEAVNQLADRILELEIQEAPGQFKAPRERQKRLWNIKYELIAKNVFGVDLNGTAVELARFSLWLNCIGAGKEPLTFAGKLKVGNSLIGARFQKGADGIYPWLLIDDGMLNFAKKLKDYDSGEYEVIRTFRSDLLSSRVNAKEPSLTSVQKKAEKLFSDLGSSDVDKVRKAYERLKWCSDLWCCYFFFGSNELRSIPKTHQAFLALINVVLEAGPDSVSDPEIHRATRSVVDREKFFHWDIEYHEIIQQGGFDLILGNPPWVVVEWQDALYVSDNQVVPVVLELNTAQTRAFIDELKDPTVNEALAYEFKKVAGYSNLLGGHFYRSLEGIASNTYKAFDVLGFYLLKDGGAFGIIQEDGVLEDKSGGEIRRTIYNRLRFHFQFQNEKFLFAEVGHAKRFSINVFSSGNARVCFDHVGSVFLPVTLDECYRDTDGSETLPLVKAEAGGWETRGHLKRIVKIDADALTLFNRFLGNKNGEVPVFLNLHSTALLDFIRKVASADRSIADWLGAGNAVGSEMLHETIAQDRGQIRPKPGRSRDYFGVIFTGPHITVGNPLAKECKESYQSKFSFDSVDLENMSNDFVPRTLFHPTVTGAVLDLQFPSLGGKSYRSFYRFLTRKMVNPTNERCTFAVIVPPGTMHTNGMLSVAALDVVKLVIATGIASTLISDGILRLLNKTNFYPSDFLSFRVGANDCFLNSIGRRTLALNGLSDFYDDLWIACSALRSADDVLLDGTPLKGFGDKYARSNALRRQDVREQALIEIDALTALNFDITAEELVQVYESLFPVLNMYDRERGFDRKTRLAAAHRKFKERGW